MRRSVIPDLWPYPARSTMRGVIAATIAARRNGLVVAVLALTVLFTPANTERYGDNLQIALPLAGLACAAVTGQGGPYLVRFGGMWLSLHGIKRALGEAPINHRPGGGLQGFPSGHTAAAVFGASSLTQACLSNAPLIQTAVIVAAAYVGGSRIETGRHDIWQVLAGTVLALMFERGLRRRGQLWFAARRLARVLYRRIYLAEPARTLGSSSS